MSRGFTSEFSAPLAAIGAAGELGGQIGKIEAAIIPSSHPAPPAISINVAAVCRKPSGEEYVPASMMPTMFDSPARQGLYGTVIRGAHVVPVMVPGFRLR